MNLHLGLLAPELVLTLAVLALLAQSMGPERWLRWLDPSAWLPVAGLAAAVAALATLPAASCAPADMFYGSYRVDAMAQFFKLAMGLTLAVTAANAQRLSLQGAQGGLATRGDWFLLLGIAGWGFTVLASCVELVTMVVALEAASFCLYGLVPLRAEDKRAAEAGIKYVLFGAAATGLALFGLGALMAGTGTAPTMQALLAAAADLSASPLATLGLILFVLGFLFKLALFPFHFWAPDVFDGASNETAAAVASLPKLGAMVVLVRLGTLWAGQATGPGADDVTLFLAVLAAASMTFGNLMALAQRDLKRLLGFSSVAHAGYAVIGLVAGTAQGLAASAYYSLVYALGALTAFWVVCRLSHDGRNLQVEDLAGLHRRAPMLALALAASAFALVGLPPTAGFMGKFFLLTAAWESGYAWLVVVASVNAALAIFYYLNLVRHAYTGEVPEEELPASARTALASGVAMVLAGLTLALGLVPGPLYDLAVAAGHQLLR